MKQLFHDPRLYQNCLQQEQKWGNLIEQLRERFKYSHNDSKEQTISTIASEAQGVTTNILSSNPMQEI